MVLVKEYRIPMPFTVAEYGPALLYSVAKMSEKESTGSDGVQIITNVPYSNLSTTTTAATTMEAESSDPTTATATTATATATTSSSVDAQKQILEGAPANSSGQYTYKIYHLKTVVPGWASMILPTSMLQLHEHSWNAYPHSKTVLKCPFFGDKFSITVLSNHIDNDIGTAENAVGLEADQLKKRKVKFVNIAVDQPNMNTPNSALEDPAQVRLEKTARGPLTADWFNNNSNNSSNSENAPYPIMCVYKVLIVECRVFGIGGKVESKVEDFEDQIFLKLARLLYCWADQWHGMTVEDIRLVEEEAKRALDKLVAGPSTEPPLETQPAA